MIRKRMFQSPDTSIRHLCVPSDRVIDYEWKTKLSQMACFNNKKKTPVTTGETVDKEIF